jgi:hypothetical protein
MAFDDVYRRQVDDPRLSPWKQARQPVTRAAIRKDYAASSALHLRFQPAFDAILAEFADGRPVNLPNWIAADDALVISTVTPRP